MALNLPYRQPYNQPYYGWETSLERGDDALTFATPRNSSGYDEEDGTIHIEHHHHHHQHVPETPHRPRARFVDFVELPETRERRPMMGMKEKKKKGGVISRSVDDAADGFIQAKHRNFEARQWSTFKM